MMVDDAITFPAAKWPTLHESCMYDKDGVEDYCERELSYLCVVRIRAASGVGGRAD